MNIICIIPARGGSKGLPGKNTIDFCGKPLITWSIDQAHESKYIGGVFVSTDDMVDITIASERAGARVIKRPDELSTDTSSSEDAIKHAIKTIEKDYDWYCPIDYIVFLQCTSPVRLTSDIDEAIEMIIKEEADSLMSVSPFFHLCAWTKHEDGSFTPLGHDIDNRKPRQVTDHNFFDNGSIYIFKPEVLKKYNNRLGGKIILYEMPLARGFEIDDKETLNICRTFMKQEVL